MHKFVHKCAGCSFVSCDENRQNEGETGRLLLELFLVTTATASSLHPAILFTLFIHPLPFLPRSLHFLSCTPVSFLVSCHPSACNALPFCKAESWCFFYHHLPQENPLLPTWTHIWQLCSTSLRLLHVWLCWWRTEVTAEATMEEKKTMEAIYRPVVGTVYQKVGITNHYSIKQEP